MEVKGNEWKMIRNLRVFGIGIEGDGVYVEVLSNVMDAKDAECEDGSPAVGIITKDEIKDTIRGTGMVVL